jgi:hypothetical protein
VYEVVVDGQITGTTEVDVEELDEEDDDDNPVEVGGINDAIIV